MRTLRDRSGRVDSGSPGTITILVMFLAGFLLYKFVPPYYRFLQFQHEISEIINLDIFDEPLPPPPAKITRKIIKASKRHGVPLAVPEEQVEVKRIEGTRKMSAKISYRERIRLPLYGDVDWDFHIYAVQNE